MRLCVVGNGPSAEGKGAEIDACDFVVRMKEYYTVGAEDAGGKLNALAHYDAPLDYPQPPALDGRVEFWFTHCTRQLRTGQQAMTRLMRFFDRVERRVIRVLYSDDWTAMVAYLKSHPSTGFVAVFMALQFKQPQELVLYGFDSTTVDRPNFWDARTINHPHEVSTHHDTLAEKRALRQIANGRWLGKPTDVKLTWPDMPEIPE